MPDRRQWNGRGVNLKRLAPSPLPILPTHTEVLSSSPAEAKRLLRRVKKVMRERGLDKRASTSEELYQRLYLSMLEHDLRKVIDGIL